MRRNKQKALLLAALIGTVTVTSVIPPVVLRRIRGRQSLQKQRM